MVDARLRERCPPDIAGKQGVMGAGVGGSRRRSQAAGMVKRRGGGELGWDGCLAPSHDVCGCAHDAWAAA